MRIAKGLGLVGLIFVLVLSARSNVVAQTPTPLYYPETMHSIQGQFLAYWRSVPEPLTLFGYPITDEFSDSITGRTTQYFQRARFDLVMTDRGPVVQLADLGTLLQDDLGAPSDILETGPTCRLFPKSGHTVCYAFLQFYDANQGALYFGDPISGIEIRDGLKTQYFERARMEWQPSRPSGQHVVLAYLGRLAYDKYEKNRDRIYTLPGDIPFHGAGVTSLSVHAFARQALIRAGAEQTLYVIVQDQGVEAVQGAQATINVVYPDGQGYPMRQLELSGSDGIIKVTFPVSQFPPNSLVQINVTVEYQGLKASTISSFRIWY
jgi:hypothetical protein